MNNFQPINNGDSGLEARIKINNLGTKALGTEHETDASAHPGFISCERAGSRVSENPLNAEQTENIGSQLAFNTYGYDGAPWAKVKYIGAYSLNALTVKRIIAKYSGNETSMPSYWGINEEYIGGVNDRKSNFFGGIFIISRNEEDNKASYPYKVILFSGKDGQKKAYFKNGTIPELTDWAIIGGNYLPSDYFSSMDAPDRETWFKSMGIPALKGALTSAQLNGTAPLYDNVYLGATWDCCGVLTQSGWETTAFWHQKYDSDTQITWQTRFSGKLTERRSKASGGSWSAWADIGRVEPYFINQIPSNPTDAQMIEATGGGGNLRDAIDAGRPVYGYWGSGGRGPIMAAAIQTSGNIILLVIPDQVTMNSFRMIVWLEGAEPVESVIGGDPVYSTTGLYALTPSAGSEDIAAAIGGWDNLTAAIQSGKTIIDTTAGVERVVYGARHSSVIIYLYMSAAGGTQDERDEIKFEIINSGGLALNKFVYKILTQYDIAANTGNSTDAGKVIALNEYGKLPDAVIPNNSSFIQSYLATGQAYTLDYPWIGVADIYQLFYQSPDAEPDPPLVIIPNYPDPRQKIKIQLEMSVTGSIYPCVINVQDATGTGTLVVTPSEYQDTIYIVAEQFEPGKFIITYSSKEL